MFCPKCGSNISIDAKFCPDCGANLEKAKYLLKESPGISDISEPDSIIELSLDGDAESLIVLPNTRKKFYLKVKNNSKSSLYDVEVILSGPPEVQILLNSRIFPIIREMGTNFIPLIILPRTSGTFTLTAKLYSNIGSTITLPIEVRAVAPAITVPKKIREEKYLSKKSPSNNIESDSVSESRTVATTSTANRIIEVKRYILKESPGITKSDSVVELSLRGNPESLIVLPKTRKKFYLNVKNNSTVSLHDVEVTLSGPPEVEIVLNSRKFPLIRAKGTNSIPIIIILRTPGVFTLTAKLHSNTGLMVTLPIELQETKNSQQSSTFLVDPAHVRSFPSIPTQKPIQKPLGRKNQVLAVSGIFALIGLICIFSVVGIILNVISSGYIGDGGPTAVITLLVIGMIFLFIGLTGATRGKCCVCAYGPTCC